MTKLNTIKDMIKPSVVGTIWYCIIALLAIAVNAHYLNSLIYNKSTGQAMPHLSSGFSSVLNWTNSAMLNHLGLSTSNNLVVGLTWGCIGLVVYVLCMNMINFFKHLAGTYELKNYVSPTDAPKNQLLFQSLGKLFFQLLMTVVLVLYIIKLLAPVMLGHILPVPKQSVADLGADLIRIAVYILVLHGFVIILRLLMLRERLGEEEELPETHNL